jgi:hypothetical protein
MGAEFILLTLTKPIQIIKALEHDVHNAVLAERKKITPNDFVTFFDEVIKSSTIITVTPSKTI